MERGTIYPSWRHHRTKASVLCLDAAQDAELGDEWNDTGVWPAEAPAETTEPEPEAPKRRNKKA